MPPLIRNLLRLLGVLVVLYLVSAYFILPAFWRHYEHHPAMEEAPKTARTAEGIPGDPLNVGLVGTESEVIRALAAAHWVPADPVTFASSLGIVESVLLKRPDPQAPVSHLYLWGRHEDLAFEKPAGESAKERHHVRFWKSLELGQNGMPFWIGSATFDRSVGLSHRTGQITHHIAPDVDSERDHLIGDLKAAGQLSKIYQVTGVGPTLAGRNGGGDWYWTDGELTVGVVSKNNLAQPSPATLENPAPVDFKNKFFFYLKDIFRGLGRHFLSRGNLAGTESGADPDGGE